MIAILGGREPAAKITKELLARNIDIIIISPSLRKFRFKQTLRDHKVIHFVGSPTVSIVGILALLRFRFWKKKIIVTWRGTDVLIATKNPFFGFCSKILQSCIDVNNALSDGSIKELESIGVKTKFQPNPTFKLFRLRDLPEEPNIAVYLPDVNDRVWNFYQGNLIKKLVNAFPEIKFTIIRNSGRHFNEKNVTCHRWVEDMEELYAQVIGVIRIPIHDAIGNTIIEALSMGRNMISSSVEFPHCKIIKNYDELEENFRDLINNPTLNRDGSSFVHEKYDRERIIKQVISTYEKLSKS